MHPLHTKEIHFRGALKKKAARDSEERITQITVKKYAPSPNAMSASIQVTGTLGLCGHE
jgi:hypothetical protein